MMAMNCARSRRYRPETLKKLSIRYNAQVMGFLLEIIIIAEKTDNADREMKSTDSKFNTIN